MQYNNFSGFNSGTMVQDQPAQNNVPSFGNVPNTDVKPSIVIPSEQQFRTEPMIPVGQFTSLDDNSKPDLPMPEMPENKVPNSDGEMGLYNGSFSSLVNGEQRMVQTVGGGIDVVSTPDHIVQGIDAKAEFIPPRNPDDNKDPERMPMTNAMAEVQSIPVSISSNDDELKKEKLERVIALIAAYTDYKSLLKTFGKDDIKDVLIEARQEGMDLMVENLIGKLDTPSNDAPRYPSMTP